MGATTTIPSNVEVARVSSHPDIVMAALDPSADPAQVAKVAGQGRAGVGVPQSKSAPSAKKQKGAAAVAIKARRRSRILVTFAWIIGVLVLVSGLLGAGWYYLMSEDVHNAQFVPVGVTLNGDGLGGKSEAQVRTMVEDIIASHMESVVIVVAGETQITLRLEDYVSSDPDTLVKEIMSVREDTPLLDRLRHDYLSEPIRASFETGYLVDTDKVHADAEKIALDHSHPAVDATMYFVGYTPTLTDSSEGYTIDADQTAQVIERAILDNIEGQEEVSHVTAISTVIAPEVTRDDLMVPALTVNIGARQVMLWNGDQLVKTYTCAVGRPAYPTIPGEYYIGIKEVNPPWYNPDPEGWGAGSPKYLPGPNDALGARGMHIFNYAGHNTLMLFHGALAGDKAGTATTHGCIRMFNSDVTDLYERVPMGTRVSLAY
jgi:lipoprotein-anchoring transpeptidase ErfK/SrfK